MASLTKSVAAAKAASLYAPCSGGVEVPLSVELKHTREETSSKCDIEDFHPSNLQRIVAGGISGMCAVVIGHPLDSVKVRLQICKNRQPTSFRRVARTMLLEEGVSTFFRGVVSPLIMRFAITGAFFAANGFFKDRYTDYLQSTGEFDDGCEVLPIWAIVASGALSGTVLAPLVSPSELVKVQLQTDRLKSATQTYSSTWTCLKTCIQQRGLFRGYWMTTCRLAPGWAVYVGVYESVNRFFNSRATLGHNDVTNSWATTARVVLAGYLAGCISWIAQYPQDFIKTRQQSHPIERWNYTHTMRKPTVPLRAVDVVSHTYRRYGCSGFYRGLSTCLLRAGPANLTQYWVYEFVMHWFHTQKNNSYSDDDV